jgi:hypothetical protein
MTCRPERPSCLPSGDAIAHGKKLVAASHSTGEAPDLYSDVAGSGTAGIDFSQLDVSGNAVLGGTLELDFLNGFTPGAYEFLLD